MGYSIQLVESTLLKKRNRSRGEGVEKQHLKDGERRGDDAYTVIRDKHYGLF